MMFFRVTTNENVYYFKNESDMWIWIEALDFLNDPVSIIIETCIFEEGNL